MTDEQAEALGRRWMACPAFVWMAGMLRMDGQLAIRVAAGGLATYHPGSLKVAYRQWAEVKAWIPDVRSPATLGCLEAQVRATLGRMCIDESDERWGDTRWEVSVWSSSGLDSCFYGASKAEALIAALEATSD